MAKIGKVFMGDQDFWQRPRVLPMVKIIVDIVKIPRSSRFLLDWAEAVRLKFRILNSHLPWFLRRFLIRRLAPRA